MHVRLRRGACNPNRPVQEGGILWREVLGCCRAEGGGSGATCCLGWRDWSWFTWLLLMHLREKVVLRVSRGTPFATVVVKQLTHTQIHRQMRKMPCPTSRVRCAV